MDPTGFPGAAQGVTQQKPSPPLGVSPLTLYGGPGDKKKDQVTEARQVVQEMNDKAHGAIDDRLGRSTPDGPKK
jgi:hypothetical protein